MALKRLKRLSYGKSLLRAKDVQFSELLIYYFSSFFLFFRLFFVEGEKHGYLIQEIRQRITLNIDQN